MCSKCHALKRADQQVGPSLEGVATRLTPAELLESMLDPGAKVAPGYGIQMLELTNGSTGTQMCETAEAIGVMPPMKQLLTIREMRDLVAFLATLKISK
jgi:quinoprotein glucose dehydrogenase